MTLRIVLCGLVSSLALQAQKSFEGSITYTTKIEGAMAEQMKEMLQDQLPEKMVVRYRGNRGRSEVGSMAIITDGEAGLLYLLNPALQTYQKVSITEPKDTQKKPKITKTKEKTKILGYSVTKYLMEVDTEQGPMKMEMWVTPELRVADVLKRSNPLAQGAEVEGIPLRISMDVPGVDLRITFLATQLSKTPPDESLFRIPEGYVEEKTESASPSGEQD